jgi:hypothetical protein
VSGRDASGNSGAAAGSYAAIDPVVQVTSPNTTISWGIGSTQTITWSGNLGTSANVTIELSRDGGSTWTALAPSAPNTGSFNWTVSGPNTGSARLRVSWTVNPAVQDQNDANFTIAPPFVSVTAPNTAVSWSIGTTHAINWNHNLGTSATMRIEVSRDSGSTWALISASVPNAAAATGTYNWDVTGPKANKARIRVSWTSNTAINDRSDVNFSIR